MKNKILNTKLFDNQIALFYLGQVGYIIKYKDKYIMTDAYLSDYVDRNCCSENVKWIRRYAAPISAEELDFVDFIFCTHAHYDHADPDTLSAVAKINKKARFYVSRAIAGIIESYGIEKDRIVSMKDGEKIVLDDDIFATAIKSAHEEFHVDENGDYLEVGFKFDFGKISVFHGGDGCPYQGLEESIKGCDILILPINGRDFYRTNVLDIIGCFDSREALTIAKNIGAKLLIPTHFDLYDVNCVNPAHFVDELTKINPTQRFHIFAPGEGYIYSETI
ncbi:MAG: MBL fold metallo-hydrolase [Ruminococcaceae bacterium]|nr:MBL fold metallo-hydrolase [Oscillospiraceae bacterium]